MVADLALRTGVMVAVGVCERERFGIALVVPAGLVGCTAGVGVGMVIGVVEELEGCWLATSMATAIITTTTQMIMRVRFIGIIIII